MHGGVSRGAGAPEDNQNGLKHGLYGDGLSPEEKRLWERVEVDSLDDEVKLVKLQLRRCVILIQKVEEEPDSTTGFGLAETKEEEIEGDETSTNKHSETRRRPDLYAIRDRLILRLSRLLTTKVLMTNAGLEAGKTAEQFAEEIRNGMISMVALTEGDDDGSD